MTAPRPLPAFVRELTEQLRRRGLPLGVDDYVALRQALAAGFGLSSRAALLELCVTLWAKSTTEEAMVRAAFARVDAPDWTVEDMPAGPPAPQPPAATAFEEGAVMPVHPEGGGEPPAPASPPPAARQVRGLPLAPPRTGRRDSSLVFTPQYPMTEREVAQTWRGLRRPTRQGPATELDVAASLDRYARVGVPVPPVLVPARRNTTRLVLLIDRQGSMTPFHDYVDHVRRSIERAGRLSAFTVVYFRNTLGRSADRRLLDELPDPFSPAVDAVLRLIPPLSGGWVYDDPDLTMSRPLAAVLDGIGRTTGAVVISDAGAARGRYSAARLLDTMAFGRALMASAGAVAWLNPLPAGRWPRTTAGQVARHLPMFELTREGMYRAADVVRGRPTPVDRPL